MVSFPLGADQAFFQVGGEMIARNGSVPYRDFVDHKPLLFYIYSIAVFLFGSHESSIRLFDAFYHFGALFYFYKILRRVYSDERIAFLSILLYTIYYVGGGYWITAEAESFAFIPLLLLTDSLFDFETDELYSQKKILRICLKVSAAFLLLITLKISFGAPVILALICFIFFSSQRGKKHKIHFLFFSLLSCGVFLGAAFLFFYVNGALPNLLLALEWTKRYSELVPLLSSETFRQVYLFLFPGIFITTLSASYLLMSVAGIVLSNHGKERNIRISKEVVFQHILFWQLAWGLIGILYERRELDYHFTRIAWILMPFVSIALITYYEIFRDVLRTKSVRTLLHIAIISVFILFSPLPKAISQSFSWVRIALQGDHESKIQLLKMRNYDNENCDQLAGYLKSTMRQSDQLFFWGIYSKIYLTLDKLPPTFCIASPLLMAPWAPAIWKEEMMSQLQIAAPAYFVCEHNDSRYFISGLSIDSYTYLLQWQQLREYLLKNYTLVDSSERFTVYCRNK
jgi:hypothetical protein